MIVLGLISFVAAGLLYNAQVIGSICGDGWESSSTGSGRCSNHDGVASDIEKDTLVGTSPTSALNVPRWGLASLGFISTSVGAALVGASRRRQHYPAGTGQQAKPADAEALPDLGVIEVTAKIRKGRAGTTVAVSTDGGPTTTVPFFFDIEAGRGARRLSELMNTSPKRRLGRRGRTAVERYGAELFGALLPEPALSRYREALSVALRNGSRLRIALDLDEQTADLPWEYLFDSERSLFLAMSKATSLVRLHSDGHDTHADEPIERLRVLLMVARPRTMAALDVEAEAGRIEQELAGLGDRVDVNRVHGESFDDLRRALNEHEPHVFHFVGHGHWDDELDDGAVAFVDEDGAHQPVSGRDLGVILARSHLRLVLFNSCDAARTSQRDRFAGVAGSLVAQGVPAAIGMQYPIEDRSAGAFGREFLGALVRTGSIDDALSEARTAIYTSRSAIEWGTPVLTTRVPVDEIIRWAAVSPASRPTGTSTSRPG